MTIIEQIQRDEGFRRRPYMDTVGKLTVGYGRNLDDVGLSQDEAYVLLVNDVNAAKASLEQALPWSVTLDEARLAVLINMTFNLGIGGLMKFRDMLAAMEKQQWETAADEMLASRWATQVGSRSYRLSVQMRTGTWQ